MSVKSQKRSNRGNAGPYVSGSREAHLTLTTDNGTQFISSRFLEKAAPTRDHAPPHGLSSPERQQLHRTIPPQLEPPTTLSLAGSRGTITTALTAACKIALRTRPSWLFAVDLKIEALNV